MSKVEKVISDEAVEAAAKALFEESVTPWRMAAREERVIFRRRARAALEAAAPHIAADAWDEGEAAGQDNADSNRGYNIEHKYNPYRSKA